MLNTPNLNQSMSIFINLFKDAVITSQVCRDFYELLLPVKSDWFVTAKNFADKTRSKIEGNIIASFKRKFPNTEFVLKDGIIPKTDDYFVIDSISGVQNFVRCIPEFASSISYFRNRKIISAIIFLPIYGYTLYATADNGAYMIDSAGQCFKLRILDPGVNNSIISISDIRSSSSDYQKSFDALFEKNVSVRTISSISTDFAYLTTGKINGILATEMKGKSIAAGLLIAQEAGAVIRSLDGSPADIGNILETKEFMIFTESLYRAMQ